MTDSVTAKGATLKFIEFKTVRDIDPKPKAVDQGQIKLLHGLIQKTLSSTCEHWQRVKVGVKNGHFLQNG